MEKSERREVIAWCRKQLEDSKENLEWFDRGEGIQQGDGSGKPFTDVTDKHRAHHEDIVRRMEQLIVAYEAMDA